MSVSQAVIPAGLWLPGLSLESSWEEKDAPTMESRSRPLAKKWTVMTAQPTYRTTMAYIGNYVLIKSKSAALMLKFDRNFKKVCIIFTGKMQPSVTCSYYLWFI